ncbi:MAG: DUF4230 domain-containing protein [Bacteroidetes bacterium]|nr:MAG: DUF4230 domain-containing protein [Bacteroidota bacterium]
MKLGREHIRLIKNISITVVIGILAFILYDYFKGDDNSADTIADTPIRIEAVKKIAEIGAVSYTDEIVVDTVEYYDELDEISDWLDAYELSQRLINRNVKRRLTLIVKGEIRVGIDIRKNNIEINRSNDTVYLKLSNPELLEVNLSPSGTDVYQEQGSWSDKERTILELKAKQRLINNSVELDLINKARVSTEKLFKRLLQHEKYVEFIYPEDN